MRFLSSIRIVRVALALAVALWLAGAGCLLGCQNMVAAATANESSSPAVSLTATNSQTIVAARDACASMHSHGCCARHGGKPASKPTAKSKTPATASAVAVELGATSSTMMDCPLAVNATAALAKARPDQSSSALPLTRANAALPYFQEQATALSPPPFLPNRGHSYLRCCVFLI